MYINKSDDNYVQYFHCDCMDLQHTIRISYWEDATEGSDGKYTVSYSELHVELQSTWWQEWYKRVWTAIKYIFKKGDYYYAGVSITKRSDVVRMRDTLNDILGKWYNTNQDNK